MLQGVRNCLRSVQGTWRRRHNLRSHPNTASAKPPLYSAISSDRAWGLRSRQAQASRDLLFFRGLIAAAMLALASHPRHAVRRRHDVLRAIAARAADAGLALLE